MVKSSQQNGQQTTTSRVFYQGYAILGLVILVAFFLRFYRLGDAPPGLYRDEAYNGLDALNVLNGDFSIFFEANNGREPLYIYLVAASVKLFGRTAFAIRFPAAIIGTLTTVTTFLWARAWFGRKTAIFTAALWAITLWPVHLSRVGFRTILLPLGVSLFLWVLTIAWRRRETTPWLFLLAGWVYATLFYTYLASRLTPLFLILFLIYYVVFLKKPVRLQWVAYFVGGVALGFLPYLWYAVGHPEFLGGRTGQVSILNESINQGDLIGTLWRQTVATFGMFVWRGDDILRHNPAGRPVFDLIMTIPFIVGVAVAARRWRQPAFAAILLWMAVMLLGTILAEDAPHFLRVVGVLPILLIFPALGLSQLLSWSKLPPDLLVGVIALLYVSSFGFTFYDYFLQYSRESDTGYLFEAAARELAEEVNNEGESTTVFVDQRYFDSWLSVPFLLHPEKQVEQFSTLDALSPPSPPISFYVWPYESVASMGQWIRPNVTVEVKAGALARGDLDANAISLYTRYAIRPQRPQQAIANFDNRYELLSAEIDPISKQVSVNLHWRLVDSSEGLRAFVHVIDKSTGELIGQKDTIPGGDQWQSDWWLNSVEVIETRHIELLEDYDEALHEVRVGLYDSISAERLPIMTQSNQFKGDSWLIEP